MAAGGRKAADKPESPANLGLPRGLAREVDQFIRDYPQFGFKHRNDFGNRAVQHYLDFMRGKVYQQLILEAAKDGKQGHLDALLKADKQADGLRK
jgi:hypothetical protein